VRTKAISHMISLTPFDATDRTGEHIPVLMSKDGAGGLQISPDQSRLGNVVEVVMRVAATTPVKVTALLPSRLYPTNVKLPE
jgi:hypothetical protein